MLKVLLILLLLFILFRIFVKIYPYLYMRSMQKKMDKMYSDEPETYNPKADVIIEKKQPENEGSYSDYEIIDPEEDQ